MADTPREYKCTGCGKPVEAANVARTGPEDDVYCPQCLIDRAEEYVRAPEIVTPRLKRLRESAAWKVFLIAVLLACLAVIAYQAPRLITAFREPKPVRMGAYATDAATDRCLKNLWRLAGDLQQGKKAPDPTLLCPATDKPYVLAPGANPEIHCPQPGAHGFRDIVASKKNPVPLLKK